MQLVDGAGLVTVLIGGALTARPQQTVDLLGLGVTANVARGLGAIDLVVGPKLLAGERRYPWMILRTGLNFVLAGQYHRQVRETGSNRARAGFVLMTVLTVLDGAVAFALARRERARG